VLILPALVLNVTVPPLVVRLFPVVSFSCTVIVDVVILSAAIASGNAVICDCVTTAGPTVKWTIAVSVIPTPFNVAEIFASPATADFTVAVYVPSWLSVTLLAVPKLVATTTVAPPVVRLFPVVSFNCTVTVDVATLFACTDNGETVTWEVDTTGEPGIKCTIAVSVIPTPFNVPEIWASPTVFDDVNVAVYVPFPLSVTALILPALVLNVTVPPLVVRLFPVVSFNCTVIVDVVILSAAIASGNAVICDCVTTAVPGTKCTIAVSMIPTPFNVPEIWASPTVFDDVKVAVYVPFP
jgi:hypothetical protein